MANSKAKTVKAVKRWVVRESQSSGGLYWLFIGPKPRKVKRRWPTHETGWEANCERVFEWFCPEFLHLPCGGGPVEVNFVKVRQVKR